MTSAIAIFTQVKKSDKTNKANSDAVDNDAEVDEPEAMSKFAEELRQTTRQQLGKKRQRVGVAPRRNKLDPALQVYS